MFVVKLASELPMNRAKYDGIEVFARYASPTLALVIGYYSFRTSFRSIFDRHSFSRFADAGEQNVESAASFRGVQRNTP
jgi:hypothetical protein